MRPRGRRYLGRPAGGVWVPGVSQRGGGKVWEAMQKHHPFDGPAPPLEEIRRKRREQGYASSGDSEEKEEEQDDDWEVTASEMQADMDEQEDEERWRNSKRSKKRSAAQGKKKKQEEAGEHPIKKEQEGDWEGQGEGDVVARFKMLTRDGRAVFERAHRYVVDPWQTNLNNLVLSQTTVEVVQAVVQ